MRPALHVALAVSLAGHLIHPENNQHAGATQFAACALLLLRDTGGGGVDVGSASVTLDDLRSSCLKAECGWSRPGTAEWARVLQDIHTSFARKEGAGQAQGASVGIIELAMVVGASIFMHTIFAPPPPAAQFINSTVSTARSSCRYAALTLFRLKFGPIVIINRKIGLYAEAQEKGGEGQASYFTAITYAVRVGDDVLLKRLLQYADGMFVHIFSLQHAAVRSSDQLHSPLIQTPEAASSKHLSQFYPPPPPPFACLFTSFLLQLSTSTLLPFFPPVNCTTHQTWTAAVTPLFLPPHVHF